MSECMNGKTNEIFMDQLTNAWHRQSNTDCLIFCIQAKMPLFRFHPWETHRTRSRMHLWPFLVGGNQKEKSRRTSERMSEGASNWLSEWAGELIHKPLREWVECLSWSINKYVRFVQTSKWVLVNEKVNMSVVLVGRWHNESEVN